tara:strand:- start:9 stop:209 length:201 start_codon:yes stop_codon:yes gene_type:complete
MHNNNTMEIQKNHDDLDKAIDSILNIDLSKHKLDKEGFTSAVISANEAVIALEELQDTLAVEPKKV